MALFDNSNIKLDVLKKRAFNYRWAEVPDGVIPLTAADPDYPVAPEIQEAMMDYVKDGYFSYTPKLGYPEFRDSISKALMERKGEEIDPNLILPIDSAARGMYVIAQTVLRQGDEMIVFDPVDYLFRESCLAAGGKVVLFPAKLKDGYIDLSELENYITAGRTAKAHCTEPGKRRACRSYGNGCPQSRGREVCIHGGRSRVAAKTLQPGICGSSALQKRSTHSGQYRYGRHRIEKGERDMENQNQRSNEETEIDLVELFWVLWRKLPLMIAVGLFTALLAFGGSKFLMTPTYQSVTKIYVLNKQDNSNTNVTYSDLQAGTQLVKDYSELIKSRFVLEAVIEQLGLPLSYEKLSRKVTVSTPADTRVISIAVTNSNPVMAMKIANAIRETASTHICNVMDIEAVNIVETANVPTHKASPSVGKNTMLGGMLGILMVAAIVILSHLMNDTIQTEEDVEKYLGISTLAMIPLNEAESRKKKKKYKKQATSGK